MPAGKISTGRVAFLKLNGEQHEETETPEHGHRRRRRSATSTDRAENDRAGQEENQMNGWRSRLELGAVIWLAFAVHSYSTAAVPNNPGGMLVFHGSAAFLDWLLVRCCSRFTEGTLCDDMETLLEVSIVANFFGWMLYLAYAPPVFYNTFMWGHSCVQAIRLLLVDGGDAHSYRAWVVRRPYFGRA